MQSILDHKGSKAIDIARAMSDRAGNMPLLSRISFSLSWLSLGDGGVL